LRAAKSALGLQPELLFTDEAFFKDHVTKFELVAGLELIRGGALVTAAVSV
jgi:hypothetical protein